MLCFVRGVGESREGGMKSSLRQLTVNFFAALRRGYTYDPLRNHYILYGAMWGLVVPLLFLAAHSMTMPAEITVAHVVQDAMHFHFGPLVACSLARLSRAGASAMTSPVRSRGQIALKSPAFGSSW